MTSPGSLPRGIAANPRVSQWLTIHDDGTVHVFSGKVELGQGILTALGQVAADELGIAPHRVRVLLPPPPQDRIRASPREACRSPTPRRCAWRAPRPAPCSSSGPRRRSSRRGRGGRGGRRPAGS
ncbi:molybdopterin cofactor-binding domain-containing protein [Streptosporangium lutulentum]